MALEVGVNVLEVDGRASPAIESAPTSVAAFIGRTERGVPNQPVRITTSAQFQERFGRHLTPGFLAYAVDGFFLNGGREAYVSRVVGAGSSPASTVLNDTGGTAGTLRVAAGFRGREDPGSWGTRLTIDVRDNPRTQAALLVASPATTAVLASVSGLRVGSVVRFTSATTTDYRRLTSVDPATNTIGWTTALVNAYTLPTTVASAEFRITVRYQASPTDPPIIEEWSNLSMETDSPDYAVARVNQPFTGSRYIVLTDLSGTTASGVENPRITSSQALSVGGTENAPTGLDYQGVEALHTGFFSFDTVQVQLVAAPDAHTFSGTTRALVVRAALDYCEKRNDCMYVGAAPNRAGPATARARRDFTDNESSYTQVVKAYSAVFQGRKVFGALYAPWIQVSDPIAAGTIPTKFIPPDGHVMGMYARTELERGIFKAPAGTAALLRGALDVAGDFSDGQHTDLVRNGYVNGVRFQPGFGITVAASRTLSSDTRWWFVGTRLLFNFVKSSLREGLRFVRQEPHTGALRRSVRLNVVRPFLLGLWRQGAFGSDAPDDVFTIKCDEENNPPAQVDLGNFKIEVYFYPVKPAETILIVVGQQPSGASAAEA